MRFVYFLFLLFLATSCVKKSPVEETPKLISLNIIDRNGLNETITTKDRLEKYEHVNFLDNQPYQKVLRAYSKDCLGNNPSCITSYYPNGQIKQSLAAVNGRALGQYEEWHENGVRKVSAFIVGGIADLSVCAEKSWEFDGCAQAWDDEGRLLTSVMYEKGFLEGDSLYYHTNGQIWKKIPYHKNQIHGTVEYHLENGQILQTISFFENVRQGDALRFWGNEFLASQEQYHQGRLICGRYFDSCGKLLSEVINGEGIRASFGKTRISELQSFRGGVLCGEVQVFNEEGSLTRSYEMQDDLKHGEEYEYTDGQKKLLITWYKGKIQGYSKTWYDNGNLESQKEMSNNKKNGIASIWYQDGSLMMIEEYDQNRLNKGEYYKKGELTPVSEVINGKGIATIYDGDGRFIRKTTYVNGLPER